MKWPVHIVSAGGIVFDRGGNVLIGKHPRRGWDFTGGQVENGESLEEAVLREIREETGIVARVRCLAAIYSNVDPIPFPGDKGRIPTILRFDFICDYVEGEAAPSDEASETLWIPPGRVLEYVDFAPSRHRFQNILEFDGRVRYEAYKTNPEFQVLSSRCLTGAEAVSPLP